MVESIQHAQLVGSLIKENIKLVDYLITNLFFLRMMAL